MKMAETRDTARIKAMAAVQSIFDRYVVGTVIRLRHCHILPPNSAP